MAEKLKRRLADLRAAKCVKDVVVGRVRELHKQKSHQIAVNLCDGSRLVFCANHRVVPLLKSGFVNWSRVNRIKVMSIEKPNV